LKEEAMALWNQTTPDDNSEKARIELTPAAAVAPVNANPPAAAKEPSSKDRRESVFGTGVSIEGKIEGDADVRIGGKFKGDIHIKGDLNIEKGAMLTAKIHAVNVTIGGALDGNVVASAAVKILESGQLDGDLKASTLTVAAGSKMRGHVEFGWSEAESAKFANGHTHETGKNGVAG
jgi:cytoskeletal protein CcmA (bactofilin family)